MHLRTPCSLFSPGSASPCSTVATNCVVKLSEEAIQVFDPGLLFIGFYVWAFRRAAKQCGALGNGIFGMGKGKARRDNPEQSSQVIFNDVVSIDGAENELDMVI